MSEPVWRKSDRSGNGSNACVELSYSTEGKLQIRDSKNPDGPWLTVSETAAASFLSSAKAGEFGQS